MTTATPAKHALLRSIGAVLAGLVAVIFLSTAMDALLVALNVFPEIDESTHFTTAQYIIAIVHRSVFNVFGAWVTARLAPNAPMRHALILGGIGFALALFGTVVMWSFGDNWYAITLVVLALPCAWLGGKLGARRAT